MALVLVLFLNISELTYLPFVQIDWIIFKGYTYSLGDILYSFFNQLGYTSLVPAIILFKATKNNQSRGIYLGIVIWNCFEMLQEFDMLFLWDSNFLCKISNHSATVLQLIFINSIILLMYYGHKKWSTSSP